MAGRRIRCSRVSFFDLMLIPGALVCPFNHICMMMDCTLTWSACWKKSEKQRFLWAGVFIFRGLPANATRLECKPASQHMSGIFLICSFQPKRFAGKHRSGTLHMATQRLKLQAAYTFIHSFESRIAFKTRSKDTAHAPHLLTPKNSRRPQCSNPAVRPSIIHPPIRPSIPPPIHPFIRPYQSIRPIPCHHCPKPTPFCSALGCWLLAVAGWSFWSKKVWRPGRLRTPPAHPPARQPAKPASQHPTHRVDIRGEPMEF